MRKNSLFGTFLHSSPPAALFRFVLSLLGHNPGHGRIADAPIRAARPHTSFYASGPNGIADDLYVLPPAFARYLRRSGTR